MEDESQLSDPYKLEEFYANLREVSEGHADPKSGELLPENKDMEIVNKLSGINTRDYIMGRKGASAGDRDEFKRKAVRILTEVFGDEDIKNHIENDDKLSNLRDYIPNEEENE